MDLPPFPPPTPDHDTAGHEQRSRSRLLLMLTAVVPVALVATALAAALGRLDTALFFVGLPALLALIVGMIPGEEDSGQLFQAVTVALLLVSAFLHEGALCVLIVSPLVYGIAFGIHAVVKGVKRAQQGGGIDTRHALGGLLLLLALEGVVPGMRINPVQEVNADRIVASDCSDFTEALTRGPEFDDDDRGLLLRIAQYPTPTAAQNTGLGTGLEVGDTWELAMPMGSISTEVRAAEPEAIVFDVTADDARTTRWVSIQEGRLSWEQTADGCRADVRITFERDLDPAFWFAPVSSLFMHAGAEAFLAGLD